MTEVGFIGPGRMGRPMVDRLLQAGHSVAVLARRPEVRADLEQAGARVVSTATEAAAGAEVVVVCVFSDDQLIDVSEALLAGLTTGAVVVSHVTGRRTTVHQLAGRASQVGAHVVDAPVSGGVEEISTGRLTVMLGGDDQPVAQADAVLAAYADPRIKTGPLGSGLAVKLVNNLLFAAHAQTAAAGIALARDLGVDPAAFLQVLDSASGRSFASASLGRIGDIESWSSVVGEFLRKDVAAVEAELAAAEADGGLLFDVVRRGPLPLV